MNDPTRPLLRIQGLSTQIRTATGQFLAVKTVDLRVNSSHTLVLLGESGSGKSMTALSIMRLLPPAARISAGTVYLGDTDLTALPEREMRRMRGRRIGMIFQEPMTSLNPVMKVGDQIVEAICQHRRCSGRAARDQAIALLVEMGIDDAARRFADYPHQYSGGMKQRAMIAMALSCEPELLIADEPTTALDVTTQGQILELLRDIQRRRNMAILLVTHDLGVASRMADHVAVMKQGEIVEHANRDEFFDQPRHPYSQALFRALPTASKRGTTLSNGLSRSNRPVGDTQPPLLTVAGLSVRFQRKSLNPWRRQNFEAVRDVGFTVRRGETLAIVGESGSGKTTLAKALLRLIASEGSVVYDGIDLASLSRQALRRWRKRCQIVFQDPYGSLNPRMSINDIVLEGMIAQGIGDSPSERADLVIESLKQVGLEASHRNRYPHEFSGGQRQRIAIARALAVGPELLICDEPTSALDLSVQAQLLDLLTQLQETLGLTYLFITHNLSVVEYFADRVAVMRQGRIVEQGAVDQVLTRAQHPYTQQLLASAPRVRVPRTLDHPA